VLATLDAWRGDVPVLITSESGHLVYLNSKALAALNICGEKNTDPNCYQPVFNPQQEMKTAHRAGQLDEDLALHAIGFVENVLAETAGTVKNRDKSSPEYKAAYLKFYSDQIRNALDGYSALGYTTVQEGAASAGLIRIYMKTAKLGPLPATIAFLEYDGTTPFGFAGSVSTARSLQDELAAGSYDMFIAGMKVYADGSNQGYTGDMGPTVPYRNLPKIFQDENIYEQPYTPGRVGQTGRRAFRPALGRQRHARQSVPGHACRDRASRRQSSLAAADDGRLLEEIGGKKIDRLQAMRAYTSDAAWLYGRDVTTPGRPRPSDRSRSATLPISSSSPRIR
jgi:predicted amidohydrolase YtcJ